jgi:two-component system, response regulator PdtaR
MNGSLTTGDCPDRTRSSPADVPSAESRSRILIIEDEALVAQSLADLVTDAGFLALGPVATATEAVRVLDRCRPHAAILDIVLRDGMATRVAIELASRGIRAAYPCLSSPGSGGTRSQPRAMS